MPARLRDAVLQRYHSKGQAPPMADWALKAVPEFKQAMQFRLDVPEGGKAQVRGNLVVR